MIFYFVAGIVVCVFLAVDGGITAFSNRRRTRRGRFWT